MRFDHIYIHLINIRETPFKYLLSTPGAKSDEARKHAVRMSEYATQLGQRINLNQKKMNNLTLLARIISIFDAFDVMTNGRPYKDPLSEEEALKEIESCAGTQFDPVLARKFVELKRE